MTKIITLDNLKQILNKLGYQNFNSKLVSYLEEDFKDWENFEKNSRLAFYRNSGVMELMPICGNQYFSYKYVNGHPNNTKLNKLTVVGTGLLADVTTGEPVLISEMTLLTALRTGAVSCLASKFLANSDSTSIGIIGCGSQSEFQILSHLNFFPIKKVHFFDTDPAAMLKFYRNLKNTDYGLELYQEKNATEVANKVDILTSCTAFAGRQEVIKKSDCHPGLHINAIGGDSPHKTELEAEILSLADKLVVEYLPQTLHEGEIQNLENPQQSVDAELWEIVSGIKPSRQNQNQLTVFDGVGFALEDYSALRLIKDLSQQLEIYTELSMIPELEDCKNLFSLINL